MDWLPLQIDFETNIPVADRSGISVQPDCNLTGFPGAVIKLSRFDLVQVLSLGERGAGGVDELEVVSMQAPSSGEIGRDQRAESLPLDLSDLLDLINLTFRGTRCGDRRGQ